MTLYKTDRRLVDAKKIRESASGKGILLEVSLAGPEREKKNLWFPKKYIFEEPGDSFVATQYILKVKEREELKGKKILSVSI